MACAGCLKRQKMIKDAWHRVKGLMGNADRRAEIRAAQARQAAVEAERRAQQELSELVQSRRVR
jgi:hypothetical protein